MYLQMFLLFVPWPNLLFFSISASLSSDRELHNLLYCIFKMLFGFSSVTSMQWFPCFGTGMKVKTNIFSTVYISHKK